MAIRVGVVGLGFMGRTHLSIYAKNKRCKIAGVCDYAPNKTHNASTTVGNIGDSASLGVDLSKVTVFNKPEDLINSKDIDAVDLCLPTYVHAEFAIKALAAGKHVLCEKPLTVDLKDADRIVAAAKKRAGFLWRRTACVSGRSGCG